MDVENDKSDVTYLLQGIQYKFLQGLAKSLGLRANKKKEILIKMVKPYVEVAPHLVKLVRLNQQDKKLTRFQETFLQGTTRYSDQEYLSTSAHQQWSKENLRLQQGSEHDLLEVTPVMPEQQQPEEQESQQPADISNATLPNSCSTAGTTPTPQPSLFPPQDLFDTEVLQNSYLQTRHDHSLPIGNRQPNNNVRNFSTNHITSTNKLDTEPMVDEADVPNLDYRQNIFSDVSVNTQSQWSTQQGYYQYTPPGYKKSTQLGYNQCTSPQYNQLTLPEYNQYIPIGYNRPTQQIPNAVYNSPGFPYNDYQKSTMAIPSYPALPMPNPQYQYRPHMDPFMAAQSVQPFTALNTTNNMITINNLNAHSDVYMSSNSMRGSRRDMACPSRYSTTEATHNNYDRALNQWAPYTTSTRRHARANLAHLHGSSTTVEDMPHGDLTATNLRKQHCQSQDLQKLQRDFIRQTPQRQQKSILEEAANRRNLTQVFTKAMASPYRPITPQSTSASSSTYATQGTKSNTSLKSYPTFSSASSDKPQSRDKTTTGGTQCFTNAVRSCHKPTTLKSSQDSTGSSSFKYADQNTKANISLPSLLTSSVSSTPSRNKNTTSYSVDEDIPLAATSHTRGTTMDPTTNSRWPTQSFTKAASTYQSPTLKLSKDPVLGSVSSMYVTEVTKSSSLQMIPPPYDKPLKWDNPEITPFNFDEEINLVTEALDCVEGFPIDLIDIDLSELDKLLDLPTGDIFKKKGL